jgi:protein phosphatase
MDTPNAAVDEAGATHPGRQRARNEDAFGIERELGLYMIADGVSRRPSGDVASTRALDLVRGFLRGDGTWPTGARHARRTIARTLLEAGSLDKAAAQIVERISEVRGQDSAAVVLIRWSSEGERPPL